MRVVDVAGLYCGVECTGVASKVGGDIIRRVAFASLGGIVHVRPTRSALSRVASLGVWYVLG